MLELRPSCECCDRDLPPDSPDARICTYECTFCADASRSGSGACARTAAAGSSGGRSGRREAAKDPASTVRVYAPSNC